MDGTSLEELANSIYESTGVEPDNAQLLEILKILDVEFDEDDIFDERESHQSLINDIKNAIFEAKQQGISPEYYFDLYIDNFYRNNGYDSCHLYDMKEYYLSHKDSFDS